MTNNKQKTQTGDPFGIIPEQRSDGVAGPSLVVSGDASGTADDFNVNNQQQDVKNRDTAQRIVERNDSAPVASGDCQLNIQQPDVDPKDTPPRLVERATGLRGLSVCSARDSKSTCRKRTERDLHSPDAEIPYIKTEHAIRDLVCSLMERQDRMNEAFFLKLNDLEYRVDDLELNKKSHGTKQPGTGKVARK